MIRVAVAALLLGACTTAPKPAAQNPSPMTETIRAHERVPRREIEGVRRIEGLLAKPVEVLVTSAARRASVVDLLIHFHGASYIPMLAAEESGRPLVVASVHLGAGGGLYDDSLSDPSLFPRLIQAIDGDFRHVYLTAFSAGYGAVRAILRNHYDRIDGILLLDGLHASYIPERKPLAAGGKLDETKLEVFGRYATDAASGKKRLVITHSEIFPGTFASTTETAAYLLRRMGLTARPVLAWGPMGMQQISEARRGGLVVLGYAGNSAPDHVDHFHGYAAFLKILLE